MLIQIANTVINTDQIRLIEVDENGEFVRIFLGDDLVRRFEFPNHDSQARFLNKIGLKEFFT
ncbi:hypothetical protein [Acinetobacter sp. P8-3-8]|uniref:hypothetical protein n=1 Tax=Acinetobacter sp. P8-3-8 TaxID=1029823 RepID=UPI0002487639|nr:hypothetical protein [Acinetobacter sp. P8-3-8]